MMVIIKALLVLIIFLPEKPMGRSGTPFPDFCAKYSSYWVKLESTAKVSTESTIEGAIELAKRLGAQRGGMDVLVTGDLPLVGRALTFF